MGLTDQKAKGLKGGKKKFKIRPHFHSSGINLNDIIPFFKNIR